jgi:hypothetical protein
VVNSPGSGGGFGPEGPAEPRAELEQDGGWAEQAERFVDAERVQMAVEGRRRERWLRERRAEQVSLHAALRCSIGEPADLHLRSGAELKGRVEVVGVDVVALATPAGSQWVALRAVAAVELARPPREAEAAGWQPTLVEVLEELRGAGATVSIAVEGGALLRGELVAVGEAVTLRDPERRRHHVVALDAIVSLS